MNDNFQILQTQQLGYPKMRDENTITRPCTNSIDNLEIEFMIAS